MKKHVYCLWLLTEVQSLENDNAYNEDITLLGIYDDKEKAKAALKEYEHEVLKDQLETRNSFMHFKCELMVNEHELNKYDIFSIEAFTTKGEANE